MTKAGIFVSLEGIDGSGTTTLMNNLIIALKQKGFKIFSTSEPTNHTIGKLIREQISIKSNPPDPATLALLFATDRIIHYKTEIKPKADDGYIVLCDRYTLSSLAYQSIDEELSWIKTINSRVPLPNMTIFIDLNPKTAEKRIFSRGKRVEHLENPDFQILVDKNYKKLLDSYSIPTLKLDGNESPDKLTVKSEQFILEQLKLLHK